MDAVYYLQVSELLTDMNTFLLDHKQHLYAVHEYRDTYQLHSLQISEKITYIHTLTHVYVYFSKRSTHIHGHASLCN